MEYLSIILGLIAVCASLISAVISYRESKAKSYNVKLDGKLLKVASGNLNAKQIEYLLEQFDALEMDSKVRSDLMNHSLQGIELEGQDRHQDAIEVYNKVIDIFQLSGSKEMNATVARAFLRKANLLSKLNKLEEALDTYNELKSRFANATDSELIAILGITCFNKSVLLIKLGKIDEAEECFLNLIKRGEKDSPLVVKASKAYKKLAQKDFSSIDFEGVSGL